jgi:hypothetical protein
MNIGKAARDQLFKLFHMACAQILATGMLVKSCIDIPAVAISDMAIQTPDPSSPKSNTITVTSVTFINSSRHRG